MVRLFNSGTKTVDASLKWAKKPKETWLSNPMEEKLSLLKKTIKMVPYDIVTLRVE